MEFSAFEPRSGEGASAPRRRSERCERRESPAKRQGSRMPLTGRCRVGNEYEILEPGVLRFHEYRVIRIICVILIKLAFGARDTLRTKTSPKASPGRHNWLPAVKARLLPFEICFYTIWNVILVTSFPPRIRSCIDFLCCRFNNETVGVPLYLADSNG